MLAVSACSNGDMSSSPAAPTMPAPAAASDPASPPPQPVELTAHEKAFGRFLTHARASVISSDGLTAKLGGADEIEQNSRSSVKDIRKRLRNIQIAEGIRHM